MMMKISHRGSLVADKVLAATSIGDRMMGLMFRSSPPQGANGLLIEPCNSIHTFFMKYALDIVFLDSHNVVVKVIRGLRPWRMTWMYFGAVKTLELPAGKLPPEITKDQILEIEYV